MTTRFPFRTALVAASLLLGLAMAGNAQDGQERCYGVARAGQNDGICEREAPGSSTQDWQGDAWVRVPTGSCTRMVLPVQPDGTPRRGALEPLERDTGA